MKGVYIVLMLSFVFCLMVGGGMRWIAYMNFPKRKPFRSVGDRWGFWLSVCGVVGMVALTIAYENFSKNM
ncbi:hypothetical protein Y886_35555 [Xanthomonas hyacinthi DSM 19077]|nr:hypothetical protein Y886_35555 [Xanthomonas hyacinthi DSM 19077]